MRRYNNVFCLTKRRQLEIVLLQGKQIQILSASLYTRDIKITMISKKVRTRKEG